MSGWIKAVLIVIALAVVILSQGACNPIVVNHPVETDIAIPVTCKVTIPPAPHYATEGVTAKSPFVDQGNAIVGSLMQHKGYEGVLVSAVKGCQEPDSANGKVGP